MEAPREAHEPAPPSSAAPEDVIRRASGGRLLFKMAIGLVVIAGLAAGGLWLRGYLRRASARSAPAIALPGGAVLIGNDQRAQEPGGGVEERPAHTVQIAGFRVEVTEVTVAMYRACVEDGACAVTAKSSRCNLHVPDRERHPINCVTYPQAEAYCRWAERRLPTEVEWEYAAGGASPKRLFPWGNTLPMLGDANVCGAECTSGALPPADLTSGTICGADRVCRPRLFDFDDGFPETAPVGSFTHGNTPEGVVDLAGNVWEWTSSAPCPYPSHSCGDSQERIIRGGGWTHRYLMSPEVTTREKLLMTAASDGVGFRCVK